MHATIGIPNGSGLLSPLIATIAQKPNTHNNQDHETQLNTATRQALSDWLKLLPTAMSQPTPCCDLMPTPADLGSYCNASKKGAGSIWFGLNKELPPIVWHIQFPEDIQCSMVSQTNPCSTTTNSDLEMVGLCLQWIVLEQFADLTHAHIACWCDNTPTAAWATKLLATKAMNAAHLLHILALCMLACQASPLTISHIPGITNNMADFSYCSFATFPNEQSFLTEFHTHFPLPQQASWISCMLLTTTVGCVLSMLSMLTSGLALWQ